MELKITPSGQTIVKPTALDPVANTDTKLLIYGREVKILMRLPDGRDESANKRRNHAGMVPADRRLIKFGARG